MKDEVDRLLSLYERREISRRGLIEGVAALSAAAAAPVAAAAQPSAPLVKAQTFNHVSLVVQDLPRSGAFCEFRLANGFLGLYAQTFMAQIAAKGEPPERPGFNHLCFGVEGFELKALEAQLKQAIPEANPVVKYGRELYVHDPDGTQLQFADVNYKR